MIADRDRGASFLSVGISGAAVFAVFMFLTYYMQQNLGLSPIANGWTIVIPTPLGARNPNVVRDYWGIVERNRVTIAGAVPTTLAAIMNVPRDGHDLGSLKAFVTGGSTVPVELIRRIERGVGVPVIEGYGMTEVHCYSTMNPLHGERRTGGPSNS